MVLLCQWCWRTVCKHSWELISQCLNRNFWVKWENLCSQLTEWTLAPHTGLCSVVPAILIPHLLSVSTPPPPPQHVLTAPFQRTALATAGFLSATPDLLYSAQPHLLAIYSLRPWILRLPNCPNIPLSLTVLHHILGLVLVSPPQDDWGSADLSVLGCSPNSLQHNCFPTAVQPTRDASLCLQDAVHAAAAVSAWRTRHYHAALNCLSCLPLLFCHYLAENPGHSRFSINTNLYSSELNRLLIQKRKKVIN